MLLIHIQISKSKVLLQPKLNNQPKFLLGESLHMLALKFLIIFKLVSPLTEIDKQWSSFCLKKTPSEPVKLHIAIGMKLVLSIFLGMEKIILGNYY